MNNNTSVSILLSTHNGEKYLPDFLNSLLQQTHHNWQLLVRDDYSNDKTLEIITEYQNKHPHRISLLTEPQNNKPLGAAQSFGRLLQKSNGNYFMFADQDDVWLSDKIEISLKKVLFCEKEKGAETPILIHTDLTVVGESLKIINRSYMRYRNINPTRNLTRQLLVQNVVTGCTTCFNKALQELVNDIPKSALMHDWWLALVASCFGIIEFIDQPTLYYRQHSQNTIGAHAPSKIVQISKVLTKLKKLRVELQQSIKQAQTVLDNYDLQLSPEQKKLLQAFATIKTKSIIKKRLIVSKHNIYFNTMRRNIELYITI